MAKTDKATGARILEGETENKNADNKLLFKLQIVISREASNNGESEMGWQGSQGWPGGREAARAGREGGSVLGGAPCPPPAQAAVSVPTLSH